MTSHLPSDVFSCNSHVGYGGSRKEKLLGMALITEIHNVFYHSLDSKYTGVNKTKFTVPRMQNTEFMVILSIY